MAIVQISQITHRKGLSENLPQLAGAEFGWVIDQRRLYIGNGTLTEGAPAVGNTEILTEYSDILNIADNYTYKGEAAGYTVQTGPTLGDPVQRTLQRKLDDFASVIDFGAVGDGSTDDTVAINRALNQLFCRETQTTIRRSLFFPAGTYRITDSINIPPFAKLYGEGAESTIIKLDVSADSTVGDYIARTADSLQQTGAAIGDNSATAPQNIEVYGITFESAEQTDGVLIEDAEQVLFDSCNFKGPLARTDLTSATADLAAVRFDSTSALITKQVNFTSCKFSNWTYAFDADEQIQGITVQNSQFKTLYQGVLLGQGTVVAGGPVGFRVVQNLFDEIAFEGIKIADVSNNVSACNIFLDVATNFGGGDGAPVSNIIEIASDNNCSVGDMFERSESQNAVLARIDTNDKKVFAIDKGERIKFGSYVRKAGQIATINETATDTTITTVNINVTEGFDLRYTFKDGSNAVVRTGTMTVVAAEDPGDSTGSLGFIDDFIENNNSGLVLSASQSGNVVSITYTSSAAGSFTYSLRHLG